RSIGIDTASIDHGPSRDFRAHRALTNANVPIFENLAGLGTLPPRGAVFIGLPMKIRGGSGGPLRAVAGLPSGPTRGSKHSSFRRPRRYYRWRRPSTDDTARAGAEARGW